VAQGRRRIAYLTFGPGIFDARMLRMARTALDAGYDVIAYARWYPGLPITEEQDGMRIVRAPFDWRLAVPGLRGSARRRAARAMLAAPTTGPERLPAGAQAQGLPPPSLARRTGRALLGPFRASARRWWQMLRMFPLYGLGWAAALETVAEPADLWHGMWAGSLPAMLRLRGRFGGAAVYDSRDVYMQSRTMAVAGQPGKALLEGLERRWAGAADRVITVNAAYARLLAAQLRIAPPQVIMNLPHRRRPGPRPDLIRATLGIPASTSVVLYQGGLMSGRGIEEAMAAILEVEGAVLCLLGFGALRDELAELSRTPRYAGRVYLLDPVPPDDLLDWTASADVSVMAIQPTSINHAYTTPQKLFESIAVGVPVVAADLPGMAAVVRAAEAGILCDPTDPHAIARAIRELLDSPPEVREARRARILQVAGDRYNWEVEAPALLALYAELIGPPAAQSGGSPPSRMAS
jgi:glycosyltransferase involved in cell wall biosynthesis